MWMVEIRNYEKTYRTPVIRVQEWIQRDSSDGLGDLDWRIGKNRTENRSGS